MDERKYPIGRPDLQEAYRNTLKAFYGALKSKVEVLNSMDSVSTDPIPVIYQSGYLIIKGYDKRFETYSLGFPHREVEMGDVDAFLRRLQSLFADTSYEQVRGDQKVHYQNVLFIVSKLMGFYVKAEFHTWVVEEG